MAKNYIQRLQEENEALKTDNEELGKKFEELSKKVEEIKKPVVATAPNQTITERNDLEQEIVVSIEREKEPDAQGRAIYTKHQMKKKDALEALITYYANRRNKAVPTPDPLDPVRNCAPVFARITKRDVSTGRKMIAYNVMPLWTAAERAIEGKVVELISQAEYEKVMALKYADEEKFRKEYNEKKIQAAIKTLESV